MAKSTDQIAEIVRTGGNLEPGYIYDGRTDTVRAMTADERKDADESVKAEESAAKARRKALDAAGVAVMPVNTEPSNAT